MKKPFFIFIERQALTLSQAARSRHRFFAIAVFMITALKIQAMIGKVEWIVLPPL